MFKRNQVYTAVAAASLLAVSASSLAESVNSTATVTVQNTFNLLEVAPISFGTIRAVGDATGGTNIATLTVKADGSVEPVVEAGVAKITVLAPGARGEYSVDGAAAFTDLDIVFPSAAINMANASAPPGSARFEITTNWEAEVIGGANDGDVFASKNLQTDATGAVGFYVGGEITTDTRTSGQTGIYFEGDYTAAYTIEVNY
jgi:hypothetical protein